MTELERVKAIIDEEIAKVQNMTPEEVKQYALTLKEPYDPIWDDMFAIAKELGYGYESNCDRCSKEGNTNP